VIELQGYQRYQTSMRAVRSQHYVYLLLRPCGQPFYVGKGCGNRILRHEKDALSGRRGGNPHRFHVIRLIQQCGPVEKLWKMFDSAQAALAEEVRLIAAIGRLPAGPLTNLTGGGEGVTDLSPEAHARMVAGQRASCARPSDRVSRSERAVKFHADPGTKRRHRAGVAAAYADPEKKHRHEVAVAAAVRAPERRLKTSEKSRAMHAQPGFNEAHRARLRAVCASPEARKRLVAAANLRWARVRAAKLS
jgi:hypothetical protein